MQKWCQPRNTDIKQEMLARMEAKVDANLKEIKEGMKTNQINQEKNESQEKLSPYEVDDDNKSW